MSSHNLSFNNTEFAFAYKTDRELKKAGRLFSIMGIGWLTKIGTRLTPLLIRAQIPFIKHIIRNTIFEQFVGGEDLKDTIPVLQKLEQNNVQVILDYGVEGASNEDAFDHTTETFKEVIQFASKQKNIPHISIKLTGLCTFSLLEKLDKMMRNGSAKDITLSLQNAVHELSDEEKTSWQRTTKRLEEICALAQQSNVSVLIDAEETWIQDPVDALTHVMMQQFNKNKGVIYNTVQLYRHDRLSFLKIMHQDAKDKNYLLAVKLVRGAYMEKERKRAIELCYPSPIQPDKDSSDRDFNTAVQYCLKHINEVAVVIASHNEESNLQATQMMQGANISANHPHIHFSQLYGMSDHITFNLARAGYSVSKYLPFGPIEDVVPYLMRRAQENSSVSGQTGRELALLRKEMKRRANG